MWRVLILCLILISCTGEREGIFRLRSVVLKEVSPVDPKTISTLVTHTDAGEASLLQLTTSGSTQLVSSWVSSQSDSFAPEAGKEPALVTGGGKSWVEFGPGKNLFATGRMPAHLGNQFTIVLVGVFSGGSMTFRFGADDDTEAFRAVINGSNLSLQHSSSAGNVRTRTSPAPGSADQTQILAFTFGESSKDLEYYLDGFRYSTPVTSGTGSPVAFAKTARDFKISNTGASGSFRIGQILVFSEKLTPQRVYAVSRYLGEKWSANISLTLNSEIASNLVPSVEPDTTDSTYVYAAVLTPKCVSCHQPGGSALPAFATIAALRTARDSGGNLLVIPNDGTNSPLYISVFNNSMPFGGTPLSNAEKALIKDWIDAGAP